MLKSMTIWILWFTHSASLKWPCKTELLNKTRTCPGYVSNLPKSQVQKTTANRSCSQSTLKVLLWVISVC